MIELEITPEFKKRIAEAIVRSFAMFPGKSYSQHAKSLGINPSVYNRIKKGETENVLATEKWIEIAVKLGVKRDGELEWKTAKTATYVFISTQLEMCQRNHTCAIFCDEAGIGKTYTAKDYAQRHKNVIYIDCSQVKTRAEVIRYMAQEIGLKNQQRLYEVERTLVLFLQNAKYSNPLIILDEVGDLKYEAFLVLKKLWNATEGCCAWYMLGADGLAAKITRGINSKKVGFAEIFDRFGARYQSIVPNGNTRGSFLDDQASAVIKVNAPQYQADAKALKELILKTESHLRRVYIELTKPQL